MSDNLGKTIKLDTPVEKLLRDLGGIFHRDGERLYMVGGAVRDLLAGRAIHDMDFTTSADVPKLKKTIRPVAKMIFDKSHSKGYGTHGVILKNGPEIEITPYRRAEGISFLNAGAANLEEDLFSRDFTVNAIAFDTSPTGFAGLVDPANGLEDITKGLLRTPRPPMETFKDDPLRTLRAVRFCVQFGFNPGGDIPEAVRRVADSTDWLGRVAMERVREELVKILLLPSPSRGIRLMQQWGLLKYWLPEVSKLGELEPEDGTHHKNVFEHTLVVLDNASEMAPFCPVFRFAALLHDVGKPLARRLQNGKYSFPDHDKTGADIATEICKRLRWSNEDTEHVADLVAKHHRLHGYSPEWTDSAVRRALYSMGARHQEIIALSRSDISSGIPENRDAHLSEIAHFTDRIDRMEKQAVMSPKIPIDGKDIMELLGISPGPVIGKIMGFLKEKVILGELDPGDADTARGIVANREWES